MSLSTQAKLSIETPRWAVPLLAPSRYKGAKGGRSSGKSHFMAEMLVEEHAAYADLQSVCIREIQKSLKFSAKKLIEDKIHDMGLAGLFDIQMTEIRRKGGRGIIIFQGMQDHTADSIKSLEGFDRAWVEEAQSLSHRSLELLIPTIRKDGSEIWFTWNPSQPSDAVENHFRNNTNATLVHVNYTDNPWCPQVMVDEAERMKAENYERYSHIWLGGYNDNLDNALIPTAHFDAAIDAHLKLGFKANGAVVASFDPSDEGPDDKGYCLRHGSVVLKVSAMSTGDANEGCDWALGKAINDNADWFTWDCDGLGVSLKRQVSESLEAKKIQWVMFRGSESPENPEAEYQETIGDQRKTNRETFYNRRAQYYTRLRDRFAATYRAVTKGEYINPDDMISLSSDIESMAELRAEVCRIPMKPNGSGKIQIMSKVEMARPPLSLPSPNLADALMMSMMNPVSRVIGQKIKFAGWGQ